jgi:hypothetical protein
MLTAQKAAANAANAQHSTGPRTAAGKARSCRNAVRHGLTSQLLVIREDERETFDEFEQGLREELGPEGNLESFTFDQIVHAAWNMQRCSRLEADLFVNGLDPLLDESAGKALDRIQRYRAQAERSYHRQLKELRILQTDRVTRSVSLTEEEASECPTLVSCTEITKRTQQVNHARRQARMSSAQAVIDAIDDETDALLASLRAKRMQKEPTGRALHQQDAD